MKNTIANGMRIAETERGMQSGQAGITLIELMVVVAIIGVLATVAGYAYTRSISKARVAEVHAIFAEMRVRQEQYQAENGTYLSTGTSETDYHPAAASGPSTTTSILPMPPTWEELRMQPDKTSVHCAYVSIAGDGGDTSNIGAVAGTFGMSTAPATNWFYMIAECDFDGDPSVNSLYFARSDVSGVAERNPGH